MHTNLKDCAAQPWRRKTRPSNAWLTPTPLPAKQGEADSSVCFLFESSQSEPFTHRISSPSSPGPSGGRHTSLHNSGGSVVKLLKFSLRDLSWVANDRAGVSRSSWFTSSHSVVSDVILLMLFGSLLILFLDSIMVVHIVQAPIASGRPDRKLAVALML